MWYYAEGATRHGPLEATAINALVVEGKVTADTLVWREGMAGWEAASDHFDISDNAPLSSASPPPVPPTPAASQAQHAQAPSQDTASGDIGLDGLYIGAPGREFGEAVRICFSKFATFRGRASRSEFWWWILFAVLVGVVTAIVDAILFPALFDVSPVNALASLILFLPGLAVTVRRLHDTDRTGWWIGGFYIGVLVFVAIALALVTSDPDPLGPVAFLPLAALGFMIYAIVVFVFACMRGTLGPNRFG